MSTQDQDGSFLALLTPANNSGVVGLARLTLSGDSLTVDVAASGLTPNQAHPSHVHGFTTGDGERPATIADDQNHDGLVSTPEALPVIGTDLLDLNLSGQVLSGVLVTGNDPQADAQGNLHFSQTYTLDPGNPDQAALLDRLEHRLLELHGLTPNGGAYDPTLPAAQGMTVPLAGADALQGLAQESDQQFLATASTLLSRMAPYMLNPEGTGPLAPEPSDATHPNTDTFAALLLPANGSGALGGVVVRFDDTAGSITVDLQASGLTPDQVHGMHIHGFSNDQSSLLPNLTVNSDGDHFIEDQEGEKTEGPVILALTQDGSISDAALTANFPKVDAQGNVSLHQTYQFNLSDPAQEAIFQELEDRIAGRVVQIHGMDVAPGEGQGTPNEVNGEGGYKPELPVADGALVPVTADEASQALAALAALTPSTGHEPAAPVDWNALAAEVLAFHDATGQWGDISHWLA
jgi:Cu/Zn superoxide dismutase